MLAVNVPYTDCGHKAPHQVVEHHDGRHRGEHAPIAIAGQQCQRTEDVKMGFDPTAREVDQDRGSEPLGDGHRVPRHRATGAQDCHQDRRPDDRAAQENGRPNVRVNPARLARPRSGRHHDRRRDLAGPLQHQQPGKQPVHPTALAKSLRGEQLFLPALDSWNDAAEGALDLAHGKIPTVLPILERCRSRATAGCSRVQHHGCNTCKRTHQNCKIGLPQPPERTKIYVAGQNSPQRSSRQTARKTSPMGRISASARTNPQAFGS